MFLEIRSGKLYVDGEFVDDIGDVGRSISRSIWVEGITREEVTDQEKFPSAFFWAWTGGTPSWSALTNQMRDEALSCVRPAAVPALIAAFGGCGMAYRWSFGWLVFTLPALVLVAFFGAASAKAWREYKRLYRCLESDAPRAIELNQEVTRFIIRRLIKSNLSKGSRKMLEIGYYNGSIKEVIDVDDDSVARVISRNPELIKFIGDEYNAELPSPEEYRRRAFDVLYGYIQDEINRLEANQAIAAEQQRIEAEQEADRRSRKKREAEVKAEADRASRVLSLPSILNETQDEVLALGLLAHETQEEVSKEPKKA